jgi:trehalose 6-phosphate phosphatase
VTAGLFTDFDGTLAPIVAEPEAARLLPGAAAVLRLLVARLGRVAVVSGRPVAFLADQLGGVDGLVLSGLYGLEEAVVGRPGSATHPEAARWVAVVAGAADRAEAEAPSGVYVERKGLAVGLHVRRAPEQAGWIEDFAATQASATGLEAHAGKLSVELRPPVRVDKGTVIRELASGLAAVAYLGDDVGDLPAFAALVDLRARGVTTRSVAVDGPEAPAAVLAASDQTVEGPPGVLALLEALAAP